MNILRLFTVGIVLSFFLTGCNLIPTKKNTGQLQQQNPQTLTRWEFKGRVAIKTKKDSNILRIHWRQNKEDISLRIYGSFGKTYASLVRINGLSTLKVEDKTYQDNNAEILLWRVLGWQIPLDEMSYWIRGIPAKGNLSPTITKTKRDYLKTLDYNNWHISYQKYKTFAHYPLPIKLKLIHPDISLKFSIQKWILQPQS
ncbi:MAG TPA: outer membrane lipoprotein LolB [Aeromonadales bacterium]|nr:outer membrane lipoprotein LolB [Aeromonadales bacterium]